MKLRTNGLLCLLLLLMGSGAIAKPGTYTVIGSDSKVGFSLRHLTGRANGVFKKFEGTLVFSPSKPDGSSIRFTVDVDSVDTQNTTRDEHLRGEEYFGVAKHPQMTFVSKAFKKVGPDKFMVTGALTIKGVAKNVSVPVTLVKTGTTWATGEEILRFKATFDVDRTEFGVGDSSSLLGSAVSIALDLQFRGDK